MLLSLVNKKFRWYPKRLFDSGKTGVVIPYLDIPSAIEEEIIDCKKSVFVGSESEIARYRYYLRKEYPFISMYIGSNPIMGNLTA